MPSLPPKDENVWKQGYTKKRCNIWMIHSVPGLFHGLPQKRNVSSNRCPSHIFWHFPILFFECEFPFSCYNPSTAYFKGLNWSWNTVPTRYSLLPQSCLFLWRACRSAINTNKTAKLQTDPAKLSYFREYHAVLILNTGPTIPCFQSRGMFSWPWSQIKCLVASMCSWRSGQQ